MRSRSTAAGLLVACTVSLADCAGTGPAATPPVAGTPAAGTPGAPPITSTTAPPTPAPTSTRPPARTEPPTTDVADCRDGSCTLVVRKPVRIPLDASRFHYSSLRLLDVSSDGLELQPTDSDGGPTISISGGGESTIGFTGFRGITLRLDTAGGRRLLVLAPGPVQS